MNDIDSFLGSAKLSDMRNGDFPMMQGKLKQVTGADIAFVIGEDSFKEVTLNAAEFLGSTNMSLMEYIMNAGDEVKKSFGEKVKKVLYSHDAHQASPKVTLEADGTLIVLGNYTNLNWAGGPSLSEQVGAILK